MGSGKTSVGSLLAKDLNFKFIDSDFEIEKDLSLSINDIFKIYGEKYFRDLEINFLKKISKINNIVISLGGGTFCSDENIKLIKKIGRTIYLKTSYSELLKRYSSIQIEKRPLLKDKNLTEILLKEREYYYSQADFCILTDALSLQEVKHQAYKLIL